MTERSPTKAELLEGLRAGGTAIVPAGDPLLARHLPAQGPVVTFGQGGDIDALPDGLKLTTGGRPLSAHLHTNALAAVAAARAVGVEPDGVVDVSVSELRGQRVAVSRDIVVVNDCYNANPMSMRAALDDLAASAPGRRVAVLGDMLELGPEEQRFHEEIGAHARVCGVDLLVTVGPRAAAMAPRYGGESHAVPAAADAAALLPALLQPGDTVLVKGSRGVGLEVVAERLA